MKLPRWPWWFYCSLGLNLLGLLLLLFAVLRPGLWHYLKVHYRALPHGPSYRNEVRKHQQLYAGNDRLLMLGNSITYQVNWPELLGRNDVAGRGIPGDLTSGMRQRLPNLLGPEVEYVFMMGGINDFLLADLAPEAPFENLKAMARLCRKAGARPVFFSTLYTRQHHAANRKVARLNRRLSQWCQKEAIPYLNLNDLLAPEGQLLGRYTYDGVHLNAEGIGQWEKRLRGYLAKEGLLKAQ